MTQKHSDIQQIIQLLGNTAQDEQMSHDFQKVANGALRDLNKNRNRNVGWISSDGGHSEIQATLGIDMSVIDGDKSCVKISSSDQPAADASIVLPAGHPLIDNNRSVLAIAPRTNALIRADIVRNLQSADIILMAVNQKVTENQLDSLQFVRALSPIQQVGCIYSDDVDVSDEDLQTNSEALDDLTPINYMGTEDLLANIGGTFEQADASRLAECLAPLLPATETEIAAWRGYLDTWRTGLEKRQEYDAVLDRQNAFAIFEKKKRPSFEAQNMAIKNEIDRTRFRLKHHFNAFNGGTIQKNLKTFLGNLPSSAFSEEKLPETQKRVATKLNDEIISVINEAETELNEVNAQIQGDLEALIVDMVQFELNRKALEDLKVSVQLMAPSLKNGVYIAAWNIQIKFPTSRRIMTVIVPTLIGTGMGIQGGKVVGVFIGGLVAGPAGAGIGGIVGGIIGGIGGGIGGFMGGSKVLDDTLIGLGRQAIEDEIKSTIMSIRDTVSDNFQIYREAVIQELISERARILTEVSIALNEELRDVQNELDVQGTVSQLEVAIADGESRLKTLETLKTKCESACESE